MHELVTTRKSGYGAGRGLTKQVGALYVAGASLTHSKSASSVMSSGPSDLWALVLCFSLNIQKWVLGKPEKGGGLDGLWDQPVFSWDAITWAVEGWAVCPRWKAAVAVDGSQVCHNIFVNTSYIYPYVIIYWFLHSFLSLTLFGRILNCSIVPISL